MAVYRKSGTDVTVNLNPNIINIANGQRVPAIVGMGPATINVVDEAIVRGTGSVDYTRQSGLTAISQLSMMPRVSAGSVAATLISANGSLYATASASVGAPNTITWAGSGVNVPAPGSVYYVTYAYTPAASQLNPTDFFDKLSLASTYGAEDTATGMLTIAGSIALENGSPFVTICQAAGSTYSEANYKTAIDKLQKKSNISRVHVVFPAGTTLAQQESIQNYLSTHAQLMITKKKERGTITGLPSTITAVDGIDDAVLASHTARATALMNKANLYVVPSRIRRAGSLLELDANYAAIAVSGIMSARKLQSTPIHGFTVTGIVIEDNLWNDDQMDVLGGGNCLVLESNTGVITIRDCISTDPTSADTQEPSVVDQEFLVKRTLRDGLYNAFSNKGKNVNPGTIDGIATKTHSLLDALVTEGEIVKVGLVDDPLTGEVKISAVQNPVEPREVFVTCSYSPSYPLKWITVTANVFV